MRKSIIYIGLICIPLLFGGCQKEKRYFVISKIKRVAKLATTETTIDKIVLGTKEKRLLGLIKINQARFVAYTEAKVKTGVDLSKMRPGDVKIDDKKIEVWLPPVEVINFSYPFSSYRIDTTVTQQGFLVKMDILDHERLYRMAELDIRNNLQYMGIKEATENKTRILVEGMLKNLDYEEIYIFFKEGTDDDFFPQIELTEDEIL
ncbi:MAG: DUF4230 domain-containing protein [Bacteroidota bacterium]